MHVPQFLNLFLRAQVETPTSRKEREKWAPGLFKGLMANGCGPRAAEGEKNLDDLSNSGGAVRL